MPGTAEHLTQSPARAMGIAGRTILVIDDEPLILLDLTQALEKAGAVVLSTSSIKEAMRQADEPNLSGAVLDWVGAGICQRLTERGVPFVIYSGRPASEFADWNAPIVSKPAMPEEIIAALECCFEPSNQ
jgi:DNA-binding response OmpR family regulator